VFVELQDLVGDSYRRQADLLRGQDVASWDSPSLCAGWRVRELIAHLTMAARYTPQQFGLELAAANGDFTLLSNLIAARDGQLSIEQLLADLESPVLAGWQPPGGGAIGALNHVVVHALDASNALGLPRSCSDQAARTILDDLAGGGAERFGVQLDGLQLVADDLDWQFGSGRTVTGSAAELISLASNRTLSDGRSLS
jgi:uncharacterized protein (TIGR03083 family)